MTDVAPPTSAPTGAASPSHRVEMVVADKGGVGKTTTIAMLAATFALGGLQVVVLDLDGQRNATKALLGRREGFAGTLEDCWERRASIAAALVAVPLPGAAAGSLRVLPGDVRIKAREEAPQIARRAGILRFFDLVRHEMPPGTEVVLIDTSPGPVYTTQCATFGAHGAIIATTPDDASFDAVRDMYDGLVDARSVNPGLTIDGVLINRADPRLALDLAYIEQIRTTYPETLAATVPARVKAREAIALGTVIELLTSARERDRELADAYRDLSLELLTRWEWLTPASASIVPSAAQEVSA